MQKYPKKPITYSNILNSKILYFLIIWSGKEEYNRWKRVLKKTPWLREYKNGGGEKYIERKIPKNKIKKGIIFKKKPINSSPINIKKIEKKNPPKKTPLKEIQNIQEKRTLYFSSFKLLVIKLKKREKGDFISSREYTTVKQDLKIKTKQIIRLIGDLHKFSKIKSLEKKPEKKGILIREKELKKKIMEEKGLGETLEEEKHTFWLLFILWIKTPEDINKQLLKNLWINNKKKENKGSTATAANIINPNWEVVLCAIIFLISCAPTPFKAPINMVKDARKANTFTVTELKKGKSRSNKKTLATTIVEECKRDDTGVGLSMAFGNQGWKKNWDDLEMIEKKRNKEKKIEKKLWFIYKIELTLIKIKEKMPKKKKKSPRRLYKIACKLFCVASERPHHQEINKKDKTPTPSHLTKINIKDLALTNKNIKKIKKTIYKKKIILLISILKYQKLKKRIKPPTKRRRIKKKKEKKSKKKKKGKILKEKKKKKELVVRGQILKKESPPIIKKKKRKILIFFIISIEWRKKEYKMNIIEIIKIKKTILYIIRIKKLYYM